MCNTKNIENYWIGSQTRTMGGETFAPLSDQTAEIVAWVKQDRADEILAKLNAVSA